MLYPLRKQKPSSKWLQPMGGFSLALKQSSRVNHTQQTPLRYQGPGLRLSFWSIRSCTGSHPHGDKGVAVAPAILPAFQTESMGLAGGRALIPPDLARLPPPRPKGFLGNPTMTYTVFSFDRPYHLGTPPPYINQDSLPSKKGTMGIHSVGGQQIRAYPIVF